MYYIEVDDFVERTYSVSFDKDELEKLLDTIVKTSSYRVEGKFEVAGIKSKKGLSHITLMNGDPLYENVQNSYNQSGYDELGDREEFLSFTASKVVPPHLSTLVHDILEEKEESLSNLLEYDNSEELIPIDEIITRQLDKVNEIDNFDFDNKIQALEELKKLVFAKKNHHYYDVDLLKKLYSESLSIIGLELVSEKVTKKGDKILLKEYKNNHHS
ncbi:MAG: hypothetical protein IKE70_04615 [Bacilli bacterium]|nr:hypothetical protein [Bacilli bacterium]